MGIEAASLAMEATKEQLSLPDLPSRGECRWRRLVDVYIEDWKTVCLRDPQAVGWCERSLLGKLIDGVFGGQSPEARECERQERFEAVEQGLTKLARMGDKHLIIAFRVYHLNPTISIAEQCRRLKIRERKYHQYRQETLEYLRWYIYEINSQGGDDETEQSVFAGKAEGTVNVAGGGDAIDRAWVGSVA